MFYYFFTITLLDFFISKVLMMFLLMLTRIRLLSKSMSAYPLGGSEFKRFFYLGGVFCE